MGPVESNSDPLGKGAGPDSQRVGVYWILRPVTWLKGTIAIHKGLLLAVAYPKAAVPLSAT